MLKSTLINELQYITGDYPVKVAGYEIESISLMDGEILIDLVSKNSKNHILNGGNYPCLRPLSSPAILS